MPKRYQQLSGYQVMWVWVLFDLPVATKAERKSATRFRNDLLDLGFEIVQFSVYLRHAWSREKENWTRLGTVFPRRDMFRCYSLQTSSMRKVRCSEAGPDRQNPTKNRANLPCFDRHRLDSRRWDGKKSPAQQGVARGLS